MKRAIEHFYQVSSPLHQYRHNLTSQCGEDGLIAKIVDLLRPPNRLCVEFGAWDGKRFSNCYHLIQNVGWSGIMIEADPEKYRDLVATYAGNDKVVTVERFVDFDGPDSLDNILREFSAPSEFGVLSIDIDGNDYYIWESLTDHRPELVVIEFNPTVPNDVVFVQEKSFSVNQGCSLLALVNLGRTKGYELAVCTEWNAFFVKKDSLKTLGVESNFIFEMYRPLQDGRIFQGFDGSIHVVGMDRLIWKGGRPLTSEDFQVLPKEERFYVDLPRVKGR